MVYRVEHDEDILADTFRQLPLKILRQGYSRVPVYSGKDKSNYIGMLLVKNVSIVRLPMISETS